MTHKLLCTRTTEYHKLVGLVSWPVALPGRPGRAYATPGFAIWLLGYIGAPFGLSDPWGHTVAPRSVANIFCMAYCTTNVGLVYFYWTNMQVCKEADYGKKEAQIQRTNSPSS